MSRWGKKLLLPALMLLSTMGQDMHDTLLSLARDRIEVMYSDPSKFDSPQRSGDIVMRLSKEDKQCAPPGQKEGVPLTFMEFAIEGVRPVDAFNVLTDFMKQPSWDSTCTAAANLGDFKNQRARGAAMAFAAKPLSNREMYEWQVVDANFTTEEFWVVFSTLNGQPLHERKPDMGGAVEAQNCLAAYRFQKSKDGVRATMTQQINGHSFPLTPRYVANMAFSNMVDWVKAFRVQSKIQAKRGWNSTKIRVPEWMLHDKKCTAAEPDTDTRNELLAKAIEELNRADRGTEQSPPKLPDGRMWERTSECGTLDVPTQSMPLWQLEFRVEDVSPEELFNILVAKMREPSWNKQVAREELQDYKSGARGVHEMLATPEAASRFLDLMYPRELWEWQAANHSLANRTYLLVLSSQGQASSPLFQSSNVKAAQCLAAYEVSPASQGGSFLRVLSHPNPNVNSLVGKLSFLWHTISERMLGEWAAQLTTEAQRLASERKRGRFPIDEGVLALLAPVPPTKNDSISLQSVLDSGDAWRLAFSSLNIPAQLNGTGDLQKTASAMHDMGLRLQHNATADESALLRVQASDALDLQLQGEALASIQWRILEEQAHLNCNGSGWKPDINNNIPEAGFSEIQLILMGVAILLVITGLIVACCGCRRYRRRKRQRREINTDDLLSEAHEVSMVLSPVSVGTETT